MKYIYTTEGYIIVSKCKQANVIGMIFCTWGYTARHSFLTASTWRFTPYPNLQKLLTRSRIQLMECMDLPALPAIGYEFCLSVLCLMTGVTQNAPGYGDVQSQYATSPVGCPSQHFDTLYGRQ
jgi:hypothetical protein